MQRKQNKCSKGTLPIYQCKYASLSPKKSARNSYANTYFSWHIRVCRCHREKPLHRRLATWLLAFLFPCSKNNQLLPQEHRMDEFEKAVLFQADPTHTPHEVLQQAIQLTNQVRASPTGWRFCFERFFQSSQIVVRIFCLQVISEAITHRYVKIYHPPQRAR